MTDPMTPPETPFAAPQPPAPLPTGEVGVTIERLLEAAKDCARTNPELIGTTLFYHAAHYLLVESARADKAEGERDELYSFTKEMADDIARWERAFRERFTPASPAAPPAGGKETE